MYKKKCLKSSGNLFKKGLAHQGVPGVQDEVVLRRKKSKVGGLRKSVISDEAANVNNNNNCVRKRNSEVGGGEVLEEEAGKHQRVLGVNRLSRLFEGVANYAASYYQQQVHSFNR